MPESQPSPFLSVVIPAFNEQQRLAGTIDSVTSYLEKQNYTWDITVVDDGSTDDTAVIVRDRQRCSDRVRLLQAAQNRGKGYAVRIGMQHVHGLWRLFMDADNSTTIDHLDEMLPLLADGRFDIVIGSRKARNSRTVVRQPRWKEALGDLGGLLIRTLVLPEIADSQTGFKILRNNVAERILPLLTIDRWAFDVELLAIAVQHGYRIHEAPVQWFNDIDTKVTLTSYAGALRDVLKVRRNLKRGQYQVPE